MGKKLLSLFLLIFLLFSCSSSEQKHELSFTLQQPIIGGDFADYVDYPSVVSLVGPIGTHMCTGTLVLPDLIITAAHCTRPNSKEFIAVVYGYEDPAMAPTEKHLAVYETKRNPDYLPIWGFDPGPAHDISIVVLEKPIKNSFTSPVLPPSHFDVIQNGNEVEIVGYGRSSLEDPQGGVLHAAITNIVKNNNYELQLGDENAPNACHGDSGGPAYVDCNQQRYVTGVTSRAVGEPLCASGAYYGIPGAYIDWIESEYTRMVKERDNLEREPIVDITKPYVAPKPPEPSGGCSYSHNSYSIAWLILLMFVFTGIFRIRSAHKEYTLY